MSDCTNDPFIDVQSDIQDVWGDTPLLDPITNAMDPLVQLVRATTQGTNRMREEFEAWKTNFFPQDASGDQLTALAQLMGTDRQYTTRSKVPVVIIGKDGRCVKAGAILLDNKGTEWELLEDACVSGKVGYSVACSPVGAFDLCVGELRLEDAVECITLVTNSAKPTLGGCYEDDATLRARLAGIRPNWQVKGTANSLIAAILQVSGVVAAKYIHTKDIKDCISDNIITCFMGMIAVHGGDDADIALAILNHIQFSPESLYGETVVTVKCQEIKFQRMCPLRLEILACRDPNCITESDDALKTLIINQLNKLALNQNRINSKDLICCSHDLLDLQIRFIPPQIGPIDCDEQDIEECTDPHTGDVILQRTDSPTSICSAGIPCYVTTFEDCITLPPWAFAYICSPDDITISKTCPICGELELACPCPN